MGTAAGFVVLNSAATALAAAAAADSDEDYSAFEPRHLDLTNLLGGDGGGKKDKKGDDDGGDDHGMEASGKLSFTVGDITYNLLPVLCCIALLCLLKVGFFFLQGGNMDDLLGGGNTGTGYGGGTGTGTGSGSSYGAPSSSYNAPSSSYGAPANNNNAPSYNNNNNNAPSYSAPSSGYSSGNQISTQPSYGNNFVARNEDVLQYAINDLVGGQEQQNNYNNYNDNGNQDYYSNNGQIHTYQLLKRRK